jgi:hypothetical protein
MAPLKVPGQNIREMHLHPPGKDGRKKWKGKRRKPQKAQNEFI